MDGESRARMWSQDSSGMGVTGAEATALRRNS